MDHDSPHITREKVEKLKQHVKRGVEGLDSSQTSLLLAMLEMVGSLLENKTTQKKALETLRKVMGILPKSERGKSDQFDLKDKETSRNETEENPEFTAKRQEDAAKIKKLLSRFHRQYKANPSRHAKGKKLRKTRHNTRNGGEEAIYQAAEREPEENNEKKEVKREEEFDKLTGLRSSKEVHTRFDFDVKIREIKVSVETVTDPASGKRVRASTKDLGPEGFQLTWNAMVNIAHLVVVFSMPVFRAALYLKNTKGAFGESTIHRALTYMANACTPVYLHTFKQLADSRRIQGDDSSTRVLEMERSLKTKPSENQEPLDKQDFESADGKNEFLEINLTQLTALDSQYVEAAGKINKIMGFDSLTKSGKKKSRINVTMITGRIVAEDQFSQISLTRSHIGSFGNLLDKLISIRNIQNNELTIQSDLSTTNLPSDTKDFKVKFAGCTAHARRPFWRFRDVDPIHCYQILRGFALLSTLEDIIDVRGRDEATTKYWREKHGRRIWELIRSYAKQILDQEMPNNDLAIAAKYIVNHFEKLTAYLHDDWLNPTNNQVERILRSERTMLNNSKFRQTKKGRQSFDVLRTIQFCCTGANVSFLAYMNWYLPNAELAAYEPENWTPYAYRQNVMLKK